MHKCSIGFVLWSVRSWFKTGKSWSGWPGNEGLWHNTTLVDYHVNCIKMIGNQKIALCVQKTATKIYGFGYRCWRHAWGWGNLGKSASFWIVSPPCVHVQFIWNLYETTICETSMNFNTVCTLSHTFSRVFSLYLQEYLFFLKEFYKLSTLNILYCYHNMSISSYHYNVLLTLCNTQHITENADCAVLYIRHISYVLWYSILIH